jgi:hypothetical protein
MATANVHYVDDALLFETRTSADGSVWNDWLAVSNGGMVQSSPARFFQYRATFNESPEELSPVLNSVSLGYVSGTTTGENDTPSALRIYSPYPNPFNPETVIHFSVDKRRPVHLAVYDLRGTSVAILADRVFDPGYHEIKWNGKNDEGRTVSSGVYFLSMRAGNFHETRRMVLIR